MPPQAICNVYKRYQKMDGFAVDKDLEVVDFRRGLTEAQKEKILPVGTVSSELIASAQEAFKAVDAFKDGKAGASDFGPERCTIYEHKNFEGELS
jgi:alkylated DNA repair protein alkB family protein 1